MSQDDVSQREKTIGIPVFGPKIETINPAKNLSLRERQIFFLWNGGFAKREICQSLGINRENLKKHFQNIRKKMDSDR